MKMLLNISFWSLALHLLFSVGLTHAHVGGHQGHKLKHYLPSEESTNILWQTRNFFTPNDLKSGQVMTLYFGGTYPSKFPPFLPKQQADLIPFSSQKLPFLLQFFGFPVGSPQAKAMEFSLGLCERETLKGDVAYCATSLESMVDFVNKAFGTSENKILTTSRVQTFTKLLQNYTMVDEPTDVSTPNAVVCHVVAYPYAVFYCHYQEGHTKLFKISLVGEDGTNMAAVAICHMDSSHMRPEHIAFTHFGIKHGDPVCHFVPPEELVWVPAPDSSSK